MECDVCYDCINISIHALRGEGDTIEEFENYTWQISIHALRGEGDFYKENSFNERQYFNPRPPWGGRQDCSG